jgi:hypothetical protein
MSEHDIFGAIFDAPPPPDFLSVVLMETLGGMWLLLLSLLVASPQFQCSLFTVPVQYLCNKYTQSGGGDAIDAGGDFDYGYDKGLIVNNLGRRRRDGNSAAEDRSLRPEALLDEAGNFSIMGGIRGDRKRLLVEDPKLRAPARVAIIIIFFRFWGEAF